MRNPFLFDKIALITLQVLNNKRYTIYHNVYQPRLATRNHCSSHFGRKQKNNFPAGKFRPEFSQPENFASEFSQPENFAFEFSQPENFAFEFQKGFFLEKKNQKAKILASWKFPFSEKIKREKKNGFDFFRNRKKLQGKILNHFNSPANWHIFH